jgi:hypothetical protein
VTLVKGAFPYDLDNLLGGRVRVVLSKIDSTPVAIPSKIDSLIKLEGTYDTQTDWFDAGAARDSASYSRSFESEGWAIQQVNSDVLEDITGTSRTVSISVAEFSPTMLALIEQSPGIETIVKAKEVSAQKAIPFGEILDLDRYRVGLIAQRKKKSGIVTEATGGKERGRFVAVTINEATITADETSAEFDKGSLSAINITFTAFPAAGETEGEEYGRWILEEPGAIPAV